MPGAGRFVRLATTEKELSRKSKVKVTQKKRKIILLMNSEFEGSHKEM
jgi:hypothetical protein